MTETSKKRWLCRLAAAWAGLMLCAANLFPLAAPLQIVAFLPLFLLASSLRIRLLDKIVAGFYMALFFILPQLIVLRFPVLVALFLMLDYIFVFILLAIAATVLLKRPSLTGALVIGFFIAFIDWLNFTIIPFWGTAQSLSRPWSAYPYLIQFESLTGITAIIFVVVSLQALAVCVFRRAEKMVGCLLTAALIILTVAVINIMILSQRPIGRIKVAAVGWTDEDLRTYGDLHSEMGFRKLFLEPVSMAAAQGAEIIVSPEMGFGIGVDQYDSWLEKFKKIADEQGVYLAVGCFGGANVNNRLMFVSPDGIVSDNYAKKHLSIFEDYNAGDGKPSIIDVHGLLIGCLICNDDNFTDISRSYGRQKVALIAVPTLDWPQVSNAHFQNTIHRAIESRFAIVRAAQNGISAVISPAGKVLARLDHLKHGQGVVVAEVPVFQQKTLFSEFGHWFVFISGCVFVSYMCRLVFLKKYNQC